MNKLSFLLALVLLQFLAGNVLALTVTTTNNGNVLTNTILGSGITASNVQYDGHALSSGIFTDGIASGLGIESGIILTSGWATDADGPNQNGNIHETLGGEGFMDDTSRDLGRGGDSDLSAISGFNTNDATVFEFDFTTTGGDLYFNFVFGSEEYIDFVSTSFNDVFGFFVDGVNIGLLPGTSTPVTINTVNPITNSAFYVNNINPSPNDIEYDGFTTVLGASILDLGVDEMHHIKFAIADASDHLLDSGVFIEAGSFSDTPTNPIPEPMTILMVGIGLAGITGASRRRKG